MVLTNALTILPKLLKYMFLAIVLSVATCFLAFLVVWLSSNGKPKPFVDNEGFIIPNSISEKLFIEINGSRQGMFIKGRNKNNPVLLYLHGGMPDYFLTEKYPTGLEENFVVVWWEQRGTGISYVPGEAAVTVEQSLKDIETLTAYLGHRFNKQKIYLLGHSGGTFTGIMAASKYPNLFHAYIGIAQVTNQLESEKLAYSYMLSQTERNGNKNLYQQLEASPAVVNGSLSPQYLQIRDKAMHTLGVGTMRHMKSIPYGLFIPSLTFREYTLREKITFWRAKANAGVSTLWHEMVTTDLNEAVTQLHIPVYFIEGVHDYTCNYSLAKRYFLKLKAPVKGFYSFNNSAHSPLFEEPLKLKQVMREDVLNGKVSLADTTEAIPTPAAAE